MPFDIVVGGFNPLALPVRLAFEPPRALGYATFNVAYEGAPGCVHGGALAATFDIVFTAANAIAEATGPTVRLDVRYRRPTLIDEEAVFEAWVTEVTARRVFSRGRIVQGGTVTVEAEGEFAILDHGRIHQMASGRRSGVRPGGHGDAEARGDGERRFMMRQSLEPSRHPGDYPFVHRIRTRFAETDAMGIVHHAAYLPYLEEARVAYLRQLGHPYDEVRRDGFNFAVLEVVVQYRRPARVRRTGRRAPAGRRGEPGHLPAGLPAHRGRRRAGHRGHRARVRGRAAGRPRGCPRGSGKRCSGPRRHGSDQATGSVGSVERRAEGEDPAVRPDQPVAAGGAVEGHADDRGVRGALRPTPGTWHRRT